jgi:hypothetical protein
MERDARLTDFGVVNVVVVVAVVDDDNDVVAATVVLVGAFDDSAADDDNVLDDGRRNRFDDGVSFDTFNDIYAKYGSDLPIKHSTH